MKRFKMSITLFILTLVGSMLLTSTSLAVSLSPTEGQASKNPNYGIGTNSDFMIQSTQYLKEGTNYIKLKSDQVVTVGGTTKAYSSVDKITLDLYLQVWDAQNSKWVDVIHVGEFVQTNASMVIGAKDVNVVKGYYYRTRSYHSTTEAGIVEQFNAYSTYIYVP